MKHKVYLRALELEDYLITATWRQDNNIRNMVGGAKYFVSTEKERQWVINAIQDSSRMVLGVCLIDNTKLIGTVNIQDIDWINGTGSVPILIGDKSEWGKGYATEAKMLALKFAFDERRLQRICDYVLEDNTASLKLHEKCGYIKEGILRRSVYKDGTYHNQIIMGLLKEEFDKAYNLFCEDYND